MGTGFLTNFHVELDKDVLFTPRNSKAAEHLHYLKYESDLPYLNNYIFLFFHNHGENVLSRMTVERVFTALDAVLDLPEYSPLCAISSESLAPDPCDITGIVHFWNVSSEIFANDPNEVAPTLSEDFYPNGGPVPKKFSMGHAIYGDDGILTSVESFSVLFRLPMVDASDALEEMALDRILPMTYPDLTVEILTRRSFDDEFRRLIMGDLWLGPFVYILMSIFTCVVFWKRDDRIRSQASLGLGAVASVLLAIMLGYGIVFIIGVPFTIISQLIPFIFFGVGLDDAFIIHGAYERLDPRTATIEERIYETMEQVGCSIFLTTMTSALAFALGSFSSVPAVQWMCFYTVGTIVLILVYQWTFFVACIALDDARQKAKRHDLCVWRIDDDNQDEDDDGLSVDKDEAELVTDKEIRVADSTIEARTASTNSIASDPTLPTIPEKFTTRVMSWYADFLLRPATKIIVLVLFSTLAGLSAWSTSRLEQAFDFTDVLPDGSYILDFTENHKTYSSQNLVEPQVIFRNLNQSDPLVRQQMDQYINDLVETETIQDQPELVWFRHFDMFVNHFSLQNETFDHQIAEFLGNPAVHSVYGRDIALNDEGKITESRCYIVMDNLDMNVVHDQMDALDEQYFVTEQQPLNDADLSTNWNMFTYHEFFNMWEFYHTSVQELTSSTVTGVFAVTLIALIFIPHWTAAFFVLPLISVLYIDMLGLLQWAGLTINPVSYVTMVMSIGLLVDYIIHVLLRYYESTEKTRHAKTVDMLTTMGESILLGGTTTFLGTLPLALSNNILMRTVFVMFVGLVTLGMLHGLVLLPVLLSLIGPTENVKQSEEPDERGRIDSLSSNSLSSPAKCTEMDSASNSSSSSLSTPGKCTEMDSASEYSPRSNGGEDHEAFRSAESPEWFDEPIMTAQTADSKDGRGYEIKSR
jgi:Niemann-Pick C1 protein